MADIKQISVDGTTMDINVPNGKITQAQMKNGAGTAGNIASYDSSGDLKDSGVAISELETTEDSESKRDRLLQLMFPSWVGGTSYIVGDIRVYDGEAYKCTSAHTSTSTFDFNKWGVLSGETIKQMLDNQKVTIAQNTQNGGYDLKVGGSTIGNVAEQSDFKELDEQINGGETPTSHLDALNLNGFIAAIGSSSNTSPTYLHCNPILLDATIIKITAKVILNNVNISGLCFSKLSSLPVSSAQAAQNVVRTYVNTGSAVGNSNELITIDKATIDEMIAAGARYVYICSYASGEKEFNTYVDSGAGLASDVGTIKSDVAKLPLIDAKVNGGDIVTDYDDTIFSEVGFVNLNGVISANSGWKYNQPISLENLTEIKAKADLSNAYGGAVQFYKATTLNAANNVGNIGSATGGANEEITITSQQIASMRALGALYFVVCKKAAQVSYIKTTAHIDSFDTKISTIGNKIREVVNIFTTDGEIEIFTKLINARDRGNCDVYWEYGTYNFTSTLYNYLRTIPEFSNKNTYELPLGGNCHYYFNNSTIIGSIASLTGYENVFGCVRRNCGNFYLHNGTIIGNNMAYCVHDEGQGADGTYIHEYDGMTMIMRTNGSAICKCIGGGTGKGGKCIMKGCHFVNENSASDEDCSWHGAPQTVTDAITFELVASGNYFSKGLELATLAPNQTATLTYNNNSAASDPDDRERWTKYMWNNETRQS